jgi:hypothetical protein
MGHRSEALTHLSGLVASRHTVWVSPYWVALVFMALGETEAVLQWLDTAVEERDGWRLFAAVDSRLLPLAAHPRFLRILRKIGINSPLPARHNPKKAASLFRV